MGGDKWWRKSVSDHCRDRNFAIGLREFVAFRKPLQKRRFPHGNGAMIDGVEKAPLRGIEASRRNGRSHVVPGHSSVDILEAVAVLVAPQAQAGRPCGPAASVAGSASDAVLHPGCVFFREVVQRVAAFTCWGKFLDGFANGPGLPESSTESYRCDAACQENHPAPALRDSVFGGVEDTDLRLVAETSEGRAERHHPLVRCQSGHVLDHDGLGSESTDEPEELEEEIFVLVAENMFAVEGADRGEHLAGGTASEEIESSATQSQRSADEGSRKSSNVSPPDAHIRVIRLVGFHGKTVVVYGARDKKTGVLKTGSEAAAAGKEIDGKERAQFASTWRAGKASHVSLV